MNEYVYYPWNIICVSQSWGKTAHDFMAFLSSASSRRGLRTAPLQSAWGGAALRLQQNIWGMTCFPYRWYDYTGIVWYSNTPKKIDTWYGKNHYFNALSIWWRGNYYVYVYISYIHIHAYIIICHCQKLDLATIYERDILGDICQISLD